MAKRVVSSPSNTSLLTRSQPALNCEPHIPVTESTNTAPRVYADRLPVLGPITKGETTRQ